MRYHDYHLDKYEVSNRGEIITFHLVYEYAGEETNHSTITFSDVTLYNFTHTAGAIITDIYEERIRDFVSKWGEELKEWNRLYGVTLFNDSLDNYANTLESEGYRTWFIESAIGFFGFVIAKAISNA